VWTDKRPVKARVVERKRSAVSLAKLDPALVDRAAVSTNRHIQHRLGDIDATDTTAVYGFGEALDGAAVAKADFQHPVGWRRL
jgi:hypothetical protein